jgi:hypothetical protein
MSHLNPLEKQLRSWTPRAPSPSLKARLFEQPLQEQEIAGAAGRSHEASRESSRSFNPNSWHWLAPAMAVFVLGVFAFGNHSGGLHQLNGESARNLLATAALSQPDMATYYVSVRHSGNNSLQSTFEWTNGSHSLTTAPPMAQTNSLLH